MRFVELRLLAFGPFSGQVLDFSSPSPGLHVLFGRNEAGKSSALRAILGLLYGIPRATRDAHVHRMPELRIGARLAATDGRTLDVVRRKGNQNTLLDRDGNTLDEAVLRGWLGGVSLEVFESTFGLDHETLREGAQALLDGKGAVGESLFGAGLGGDVHRVLASLKADAETLFLPRASKPLLNEALGGFAEAKKRIIEQSLSGDARLSQERALEETLSEHTMCEADRAELSTRLRRFTRLQRVMPLVGRRQHLRTQRAALTHVLLLPPNASLERQDAVRAATHASLSLERLAQDAAALAERRAALPIPESLVSNEEVIEAVQHRYGSHLKAKQDLPRLEADLARVEEEMTTVLRRAGREVIPPEEVEQLRMSVSAQARVRKLALVPPRLEEKLHALDREGATLEADREAARATLEALGPVPDASQLRAVLARTIPLGDLEMAMKDAGSHVSRLAQTAQGRLAALGLWSGTLAEAEAMPVPLSDTVDRFAHEWDAIVRKRERLEERSAALTDKMADVERAVDALQRAGAVPTEQDLADARATRDTAWGEIRRTEAQAREAFFDPFERTVVDADALSDRLRREAERVTRLSNLLADRDAFLAERARLDDEQARLEAHAGATGEAWLAAWKGTGVTPLSPAEMRGWLARHGTVVAAAGQLREAEDERARLAQRRDETFDDLRAALAAAGGVVPDGQTLGRLVAAASAHMSALDESERTRRDAERTLAQRGRDTDRLDRERAETRNELAKWRDDWGKSVAALGLTPDASPDEATAMLDTWAELFRLVDQASQTRRRVAGIERDAQHFAEELEHFAREHANDLAGRPFEEVAAQVMRRFRDGREALAARRQIDAQVEGIRVQEAELLAAKGRADAVLSTLMRAAHVDSVEALEEAERRSAEACALDAEITAVEAQILELGEGTSLETLVTEATAADPDVLPSKIERTEEELRELGDKLRRIDQKIGGVQEGLRTLNEASGAANAASEAQEWLARVRTHADRYLRTRLAAVLLARAIEHYRERHQGPILGHATELFRRLTLGSFDGLRVGFGDKDEPVLRCVRPDGKEVEIEGLSAGTRDQLYLALRLASLETHANDDPLPLILDDILIHFDDERSQAALEILGEVSTRRQILFFTHHSKLLELAQESVSADRLRIHRVASGLAQAMQPTVESSDEAGVQV